VPYDEYQSGWVAAAEVLFILRFALKLNPARPATPGANRIHILLCNREFVGTMFYLISVPNDTVRYFSQFALTSFEKQFRK